MTTETMTLHVLNLSGTINYIAYAGPILDREGAINVIAQDILDEEDELFRTELVQIVTIDAKPGTGNVRIQRWVDGKHVATNDFDVTEDEIFTAIDKLIEQSNSES